MILNKQKDPMGLAIADFYKNGVAGRLRVFSPQFEEDEIPVETLFREYDEMPEIEQKALQMASGRILDVGAGAGCHALALQEMGKDVTAIDISPLSIETIKKRGVEKAELQDFFDMAQEEKHYQYDTILMLMNGSGIIGKIAKINGFFEYLDKILAPNGQLLMDSSDLRYIFENEDGSLDIDLAAGYYGELDYQMQYKRTKGDSFPWLYIDAATLQMYAEENGFKAEIILEGDHYDYLARITRSLSPALP